MNYPEFYFIHDDNKTKELKTIVVITEDPLSDVAVSLYDLQFVEANEECMLQFSYDIVDCEGIKSEVSLEKIAKVGEQFFKDQICGIVNKILMDSVEVAEDIVD